MNLLIFYEKLFIFSICIISYSKDFYSLFLLFEVKNVLTAKL